MNNILIYTDSASIKRVLETRFPVTQSKELLLEKPYMIEAAILGGGPDVNPALYQQVDAGNVCNYVKERDRVELNIINFLHERNTPMIGVCRGAQLLNVFCGGGLIMDIRGHGGCRHSVEARGYKDKFEVSSLHHQACLVPDDSTILAVASPALSKVGNRYVYTTDFGCTEEYEKPGIEVEAWINPTHLCGGVQWHPEFMSDDCEAVKFFHALILSLLFLAGDATKPECHPFNEVIQAFIS